MAHYKDELKYITLPAIPKALTKGFPKAKECQVAPRQMKMPEKDNSENETEEFFSQRSRPETGRYLLKVDNQTKGSYKTSEAAQSAALEIKKGYPVVRVSIYDSVDNSRTLVELPTA